MPPFVEDKGAYPVMIRIAALVQEEVKKRGLPEISVATLQPGISTVVDYTGNGDNCAEVIVNLTNAVPMSNFPVVDTQGTCATELGFQIEVAIFRCAPMMRGSQNNPIPPAPEEQLEATRLHLADMQAARAAIRCAMGETDRNYVLGAFTPYGPSGGVVGGIWVLTFGMP